MTDWPTIIREHGPLVWRTAYRLLSHHADAGDCFQRTFLAAVERAEKEAVRNWPALLRHLATARALEALRARRRQARRTEVLPDRLADPTPGSPPEAAAGGELADRLREALAEIDPAQAAVFCLVCLEGLSNREAALAAGVTANHAGVLLHRARQALRERLSAFDPAAGQGAHP